MVFDDFLVAQGQKLGARGHWALLEHSPDHMMCHMIKLGVKNDNSQKKFMQGGSLSPSARETCLKKKSRKTEA